MQSLLSLLNLRRLLFKYGFAQVKLDRNKKFGLINTKGNLILPFEFDSIYYIEPLAKSSLELSKMRDR